MLQQFVVPAAAAAAVMCTCTITLAQEPAPALGSIETSASVGTAGDFLTGGFGAVTFGDNDGTLFTGHGDVEWFIATDLAIALQPFAGYINGEFDDTAVAGFDLLLKWYALHGEGWALFLEGGAGAQYSFPESFPDGGSNFNFRPQLGLGGLIHLTDRIDLLLGARFIHMSNARVASPNQGYNGALVYLGAMIEF